MFSIILLSVLIAVAVVYLTRKDAIRSQYINEPRELPEQLQTARVSKSIAVIVPTLNETAALPATIMRLFSCASPSSVDGDLYAGPTITVVVVDASPGSATQESLSSLMAAHPSLHLISYPGKPSRGAQMDFGAAHAVKVADTATVFLFLHADTHLPLAWDLAITDLLSSTQLPTLGCFELSLPPPISPSLGMMLWCANKRARWFKLPYGDQCYFMSRATYDLVGGFPPVPIMEDLGMLRRVSQLKGNVVVLDAAVQTSPRRWNRKGVLWNTALNQALIVAWLCGASHESIYRWYYGPRLQSSQVRNVPLGQKADQ